MNARLFLLERWLPGRVRRRIFADLVRLTADAFGVDVPPLARLPRDAGAIAAFAAFTREQVERASTGNAAAPRPEAIRARLHDRARALGFALRQRLHIGTPADEFRALRLLYGGLGIELQTDCGRREITVVRCAFSRSYTPAVCAFISALDAGIVDGITGGGVLAFSERITEGAPCCRAVVAPKRGDTQ